MILLQDFISSSFQPSQLAELATQFDIIVQDQAHDEDGEEVDIMLELPRRYIRLFKLAQSHQPDSDGLEDDIPEGDMICIPLDSADMFPFAAISYVWGSADITYPLRCGSIELRVNRNLNDLLRRLQRVKWPFPLWIDAICIVQGNIDEKASQIPLMGEIYRKALWTLSWVGSAPNEIVSFWDYACQLPNMLHDIKDTFGPQPISWKDGQLPPASLNLWDDLEDFLTRPYYSRLWIMQEVVLSKNLFVLCGDNLFFWAEIHAVAEALSDDSNLGARGWASYIQLSRIQAAATRIVGLESMRYYYDETIGYKPRDCIVFSQDRDCTDARDKVYGQLSLLTTTIRYLITPDYSKSAVSIYTEFTNAMLITEEALNVLPFAGTSNQKLSRLPSWVVDFSQAAHARLPGYAKFSAGICSDMPDLLPHLELRGDGHCLQINGFVADEVLTIIPQHVGYSKPIPSSWFLKTPMGRGDYVWSRECLKLCRKSLNVDSDEIPEAYLRTLTVDRGTRRYTAEDYRQWEQIMLDYIDTEKETLPTDFVNDVGGACARRLFFSTKQGRIGVGPMKMQVGDKVCIFFQSRVPFIMRLGASGMYTLLGDVYCYGLMAGEGFGENQEDTAERTRFAIE